MDDIVISARGISKCYEVFESTRARLMHAVWPGSRSGREEVWALRDIDLEIRRGESVGIIGRNGSGKSTLLEILTGTLAPTSGATRVTGRVAALLELGSGFNPEYTGRDNAILNGLLLGVTRRQVLERFAGIEEFAELGAAMDRPVKTYSSGMVARLAFAVQVALDPEILIVDEALSVGDFFFQQKCLAHIQSMQRRGVTILFVSHDMGMVRNVCARAIYLRAGTLAYAGPAERAAQLYFQEARYQAVPSPGSADASLPAAQARAPSEFLWHAEERIAPGAASRLMAVDLQDSLGQRATRFRIGEVLRVVLDVANPAAGSIPSVMLKNALGQVVNVTHFHEDIPTFPSQRATFVFDLELRLEAGRYTVQAYIGAPSSPNVGPTVSESPSLGPISVEWDYERDVAPFHGMFGLAASVRAEGAGS